jgi:hypothetical protein
VSHELRHHHRHYELINMYGISILSTIAEKCLMQSCAFSVRLPYISQSRIGTVKSSSYIVLQQSSSSFTLHLSAIELISEKILLFAWK